MVRNSCCIYNGKVIWIHEFYTVIDGKQINIPGKIEECRKLGKEKKLFCRCGCGRNMEIVAGPSMTVAQHFRMRRGQKTQVARACHAVHENETTMYSKIVLKCWLDHVLKLNDGDIQTNVPISAFSAEADMRYEFTHFVNQLQLGLCYVRRDCNLYDGKIDSLNEQYNSRFFYIVDSNNHNRTGQYPEYMMKIQKAQGFCIFLNCHDSGDMFSAELNIAYYTHDERDLWYELSVLSDKLSKFAINESCELIYGEEKVIGLVNNKLYEYENTVKGLKQEARRQEDERRKRREERERAETEARKQRQIEEDEKKKGEQRRKDEEKRIRMENYFQKHPKYKILFEYMEKLERVEGFFDSMQSDNSLKQRRENIVIKKVSFDIDKSRICIKDSNLIPFYIYLSDTSSLYMGKGRTGASYAQLDLSKCEDDDVIETVNKHFFCVGKCIHQEVYCIADIDCPHVVGDEKLCGMKNSQCSYRMWK